VRLSHQLESLERDARDYAQTLAQRAEELAAQTDFVTSLLETAQAVIVTQNIHGEITMVNQYGESLLGYREQELQAQTFARLVDPASLTADILRDLSDLAAGRVDHLHHELCMVCKNGGLRDIAWYHSLPPEHGESEPRVLSVGIDVTDRKNAEQRLSWLADHDPLTGLFNRRRFQFELENAIAAALEDGHAGALLFMDIDQFKDVNDSSGHPAGDALLKDISAILSDIMRDCDLVARLGGDEFSIVLPRTNSDGAVEIARRVKDKLASLSLNLNGRIHRVSTSIGIAMFPRDGQTVSELLSNADLAMYQAKDSGRGCWHMFASSEQVKEKLNKRVHWKARIEQALAEEQFVLFYQPIVEVNSGVASHFETLLRLRNEDGSITGPADFIEVAETTGLIHQIDRMVVRKAIAQLEELHGSGHDLSFSINLSAHAFNDPEIFTLIEECVKRIRFSPSRLIFEVTETAAVADFAFARESMRSIKDLGCLFALDDFGVGFSSFAALRQLPVDYVKIDGSFIKMMIDSPEDRMLVRALSQVAQAFGKKSVAEFVETAEIIELLREYGVNYAQGFYLGKPLPAEQAFAALIPRLDKLRRNRKLR
jgi:diguanylate cyclase (GGDEF)-like protein/PAS domain S-box-containing protein